MNRKQRQVEIFRRMAVEATNRNLELSTTFTIASVILAMDEAHCKINYDKWFDNFARIYPELLQAESPIPYIKKAEEIAGAEIEIHWTE